MADETPDGVSDISAPVEGQPLRGLPADLASETAFVLRYGATAPDILWRGRPIDDLDRDELLDLVRRVFLDLAWVNEAAERMSRHNGA